MEFQLIIRSGDDAGKRIPVPPGESRLIGRQPPSDVRLADDPMISNQHFKIECDGDVCLIRDLGSKFGTTLNGRKIVESAALRDGDEIQAGRTHFSVQVLGDIRATPLLPTELPYDPPSLATGSATETSQSEEATDTERDPLSELQKSVLGHLRRQSTLFIVLDAARDPEILPQLKTSGVEYASLYEEKDGEELSLYGPWLARLPRDHSYIEDLVRDGWGKSWGVYLACSRSFTDLRRHLRQFLLAKLPDGRQVCFRYYDPRVLRTYLPTCTADEVARFFGPIDRYLAESADEHELLEFTSNYRDWRKVRLQE